MMVWLLLQVRNWYVAFGLPYLLIKKVRKALREDKPALWKVGRVSFFMGILVFCPYALVTRILNVRFPFLPVLGAHAVFLYSGLLMQKIALRRAAAPTPAS